MKNTYESPYLQAKHEWFESVGPAVKSAAQWRLVALVTLVLAMLSLVGNVVQASKEKVVPYIVAVDEVRGQARAIQLAESPATVPNSLIQYTIKEVIKNWRTVTLDFKLRDTMSDDLAAAVRGAAIGTLTEWFAVNPPVVRARDGYLVSVEIGGVPLPVSPTSWRVEWTETTRDHSGTTINIVRYEATVTVAINPPTTEAAILRNPGGVFITDLSFGTILTN